MVWIIVMFLSAVWILILTAPIHFRWAIDEQVMYCNFYKFVQMKKQALHLGWPESEYIVSKFNFFHKLRLRTLFMQPRAVPNLYAIFPQMQIQKKKEK